MKRIVFFLMFLAASCHAQMAHFRPTEPWRIADVPTPRWYLMKPGDSYRPAWEYAKACSGAQPVPGGDYADVVWLVVSSGGLRNNDGHQIIGVWLQPDTIVIDSLWTNASWLAAHELLHHLRHIIPYEDDPHPEYPFYRPCMLMWVQNNPQAANLGPTITLPEGAHLLRFIGEARREEPEEP